VRWRFAVSFGLLVVLCLGQVAWWMVFQIREGDRLKAAGEALARDDMAGALEVFGVESGGALVLEAQRRQVMFAWEGATLGMLVLLGVVLLAAALVREQRIRRDQHRFLTGATHELKTPLATIRLGLESLDRDSLPAERRAHYLGGMMRQVDRLERGLSNVLAAASLESRGIQSHRVPGDFADDVRRAVQDIADRCAAADITCEITECQPAPVERDLASMRLVLQNLLDNAIKFTPEGGRIEVALKPFGDRVRLTVTDSGCGIPTGELHRIFERFHRAGPDHIGGTGLGLALVREIVHAHGGAVRAESLGENRGSRFTVDLPCYRSDAADPSPAADRSSAEVPA
jgi:signal transduction histidine kinase